MPSARSDRVYYKQKLLSHQHTLHCVCQACLGGQMPNAEVLWGWRDGWLANILSVMHSDYGVI